MTYEINITLDSRHFDTFDVEAEDHEAAVDQAYSLLLDRTAVEAIQREQS